MNKFFYTMSILTIGAVCGVALSMFVGGGKFGFVDDVSLVGDDEILTASDDEIVFTSFVCHDDLTDNYAQINIDDEGRRISQNPNGHWAPYERYWVNSLIHNEEVVVWEEEYCPGLAEVHPYEAMSRWEACRNGTRPKASSLWAFERSSGRLTTFGWNDDGSLRHSEEFCSNPNRSRD